jgi:hypothetical protein
MTRVFGLMLFGLLLVAGPLAGGDKNKQVITCKFQSFSDNVLKVTDLSGRDWEFKLDKGVDIVSVNAPKQKLPLTNAFQGVNQGRILRVFTEGDKDERKVVAIQIGQGQSTRTAGKEQQVKTCKFQSFKDNVLKVTDLEGRDWEHKLDSSVDVVSVTAPKTKLLLKNAFQGVNEGRILRVITQGSGETEKVLAVQIGQGGSGARPSRTESPKGAASVKDLKLTLPTGWEAKFNEVVRYWTVQKNPPVGPEVYILVLLPEEAPKDFDDFVKRAQTKPDVYANSYIWVTVTEKGKLNDGFYLMGKVRMTTDKESRDTGLAMVRELGGRKLAFLSFHLNDAKLRREALDLCKSARY